MLSTLAGEDTVHKGYLGELLARCKTNSIFPSFIGLFVDALGIALATDVQVYILLEVAH